jgi:hypothetical protein
MPTNPPPTKLKKIKKLRKKMTEAATKFNEKQFSEDLAGVLTHIQYAAYTGHYVWEENCKGWPRDSKVEYVMIKLIAEGFDCFHTTSDTIHVEWL